jgi:hypothetical protein
VRLSGFLTSAAEAGASLFKLTGVSSHKSLGTLRGHVRLVGLFMEHAGAASLCDGNGCRSAIESA